MRTMYDSVDAAKLPDDLTMAAGYIDGLYEDAEAIRARFPDAIVLELAVAASDNRGDGCDVEKGDLIPSTLPGWIARRRIAGHPNPFFYTSAGQVDECLRQLSVQGVERAPFVYALWDGVAELDPGMVAKGAIGKQYQSTDDWDVSVMVDAVPGLYGGDPAPPSEDGDAWVSF